MQERLSGKHKRCKTVAIRVNSEEYELIKRNAGTQDMAVFVRTAAVEKTPPAVEICQIMVTSGEKDRHLESLRKMELLAALPDAGLMAVYDLIKIKDYNKNDLVFLQEEPNNSVYFILGGSVKVTQLSEDGKEIIIALHPAGNFFGEMSLIDGKSASANVYAAERSSIGLLSKEDFFVLLYNNKQIIEKLLQIFCQRIRSSNEKIEILNASNAAQRIKIFFILFLKKNGEQTDKGILLNARITHQDIANLTGLTRETVTRTINKWIKNGDISISVEKFIHLNHSFFEDYPDL